MLSSVINLLFWTIVLMLLSYLLDMLWGSSLMRWIYIVFAAPGIIVHELSHYIACRIMGAEVTRVKLISRTGGSVTHGPPRWGVVGQAVISLAPFFGMTSVLLLIGLCLDKVEFFDCDLTWDYTLSWDVGSMVVGTVSATFELIWKNMVENRSVWFLIFLYLSASFTIAMAPSKQDLKNGLVGAVVIIVLMLTWAVMNDLLLSSIGWSAPISNFLLALMGWVITLGLILCIFGTLLVLPFLTVKLIRSRRSS